MAYTLEQVNAMLIKAGVTDTFGAKKEIKKLPEILFDDETILYATSGIIDGRNVVATQGGSPWSGSSNVGTVLCVLTEKRIMYVDVGMFWGIRFYDIPLSVINNVSFIKGLLLGSVLVTRGAHTMRLDNVSKETAQIMVTRINEALKLFEKEPKEKEPTITNSNSQFNQIKELKELLDLQIITQEEFEKKKKELLGL